MPSPVTDRPQHQHYYPALFEGRETGKKKNQACANIK